MAAWEVDLDFYLPKSWYLPVADLVSIFAQANATLNASEICYQEGDGAPCFPLVKPLWVKECGYLFGVGSWAIKVFGDLLFPHWEFKATQGAGAPHLMEAFIDWPIGGMDDDSLWVDAMWNRFSLWLRDGLSLSLSPCPPFPFLLSRSTSHLITLALPAILPCVFPK